jgi:hypothetical protein
MSRRHIVLLASKTEVRALNSCPGGMTRGTWLRHMLEEYSRHTRTVGQVFVVEDPVGRLTVSVTEDVARACEARTTAPLAALAAALLREEADRLAKKAPTQKRPKLV